MAKKTNTAKVTREMTHRQLSHHKKAQRRQNLIFFGGIGIIVVVILIIAGGWLAGEYMPMHKTIVQVNDVKFDTSFFIDTLAIYGRSQGVDALANIAPSVANQIIQNELVRQEAAKLGISVTDEEAKQYMESIGFPTNPAGIELARNYILTDKLKSQYFDSKVLKTDTQLWVRAMMCESESTAWLVREKMPNTENLTELVKQYAVDTASKGVFGDYGWHPASLFKDKLYASFPYDYISREDVKAGDLSQPLADNTSYKQVGYWLIRINSRPTEDSTNASAVLLSSEEEAIAIRAKLVAGEALGPIADSLSQYPLSTQQHGEMGITIQGTVVTENFDAYVYNPASVIGEWSQPVKDETQYTRGGYWVVQISGLEENKEVSAEDRQTQITGLYNSWISEITDAAKDSLINNLDADTQQYAINKAKVIMNAAS